jgi:hypothetical protein
MAAKKQDDKTMCKTSGGEFVESDGGWTCIWDDGYTCNTETREPKGPGASNGRADGRPTETACYKPDGSLDGRIKYF